MIAGLTTILPWEPHFRLPDYGRQMIGETMEMGNFCC